MRAMSGVSGFVIPVFVSALMVFPYSVCAQKGGSDEA